MTGRKTYEKEGREREGFLCNHTARDTAGLYITILSRGDKAQHLIGGGGGGRGDFRAARLIEARFRAYSQGAHVSMCSPRAVSYDLIQAVRVALRARARHWVKMDYSLSSEQLRLECID